MSSFNYLCSRVPPEFHSIIVQSTNNVLSGVRRSRHNSLGIRDSERIKSGLSYLEIEGQFFQWNTLEKS